MGKIIEAIKLSNEPVAVYYQDTMPEGAVTFKKDVWGCAVALLHAASKGRIAALSEENTVCRGGRVGLSFDTYPDGLKYFLTVGANGFDSGEHYKKTPELAKIYMDSCPVVKTGKWIVFMPLSKLPADVTPEAVIFIVNADQLSALVTLANYDKPTQNNVQINFGSGCMQSILQPLNSSQKGEDTCYVGLIDPSARKCVSKDVLSFSMPWQRYLKLEEEATGSFLDTHTWSIISKRI